MQEHCAGRTWNSRGGKFSSERNQQASVAWSRDFFPSSEPFEACTAFEAVPKPLNPPNTSWAGSPCRGRPPGAHLELPGREVLVRAEPVG